LKRKLRFENVTFFIVMKKSCLYLPTILKIIDLGEIKKIYPSKKLGYYRKKG
jgi:hypothetical protein